MTTKRTAGPALEPTAPLRAAIARTKQGGGQS